MFRSHVLMHQEIKIALHSPWYHYNYRWPSGAQVEIGLSQNVHEMKLMILVVFMCQRTEETTAFVWYIDTNIWGNFCLLPQAVTRYSVGDITEGVSNNLTKKAETSS